MNRNEAIKRIKPHLTKERYEHTLRVADTAIELAGVYGESEEKAQLAALFHDYAKYRPIEELKHWIIKSNLPKDLLDYHHELWHGPVGSILIEYEHGIQDSIIKNAIYYHTTGRAYMNKLDMILFVADYIEPGRDFPGLEEVRRIAKKDLIKTAWMVSRNTINYLMSRNNTVYPDSFYAYNYLTRKIKRKDGLNG
ncbi:bis(5'-nucleosyl)-tetraphosphatase (symmetrical) YqeK [Virgibacillus sp. MSJ-26]|uniref:bis(5'-nucleosyl)-tetraphosphatase (symmetrical) YqeK n=1 Tax=Virgibacillus sp. MSJ-26 TaxID=2841522 RepID=UPI001C0FA352|nr:bis(5'-nucleosyl)-tetraphosphatase (symmetrical) YqeK [Virgibacillus sp. MSJ-26]MBU5466460.1 bis(5'-nucleosyl)-tetraphosphatase (symmetrical) YqeK [Virgibacillus sp. MSJ-26]